MMNKSLVTNLVALLILIAGLLIPDSEFDVVLTMVGLFAISGALTNWLAVFMLFEKIPFLYGSGIVPKNFVAFKTSIRALIMNQFFTVENIERVLSAGSVSPTHLNLEPIIDQVDFNPTFDALVDEIMQSQFGSMLGMFGGVEALTPLREPLIKRIKSSTIDLTRNKEFISLLKKNIEESDLMNIMQAKVTILIDQRLDELTPKMVKEIVKDIIAKHLGWLVVWGGVFGGLIGLATALITKI